MLKDFQVKTISKDVMAPANLLYKKETPVVVFSCEFCKL